MTVSPYTNDRSTDRPAVLRREFIGEFYDKSWRICNFEFVKVKLFLPMPWSCITGVEAQLHPFLASALSEGR